MSVAYSSGPGRLAQVARSEFFGCFWDYQPGEHVAWFEATQQGKTHMIFQALAATMAQHPELSVVTLMPKPRSPATLRWAQLLGLRVIDDWPPPPRWLWQARPAGYVLWPRHLKGASVKENREHLAAIFRKALGARYRAGGGITVADDAHLFALLGLNPELEEHLTAGAEGGAGVWIAQQKTSGTKEAALTSYAYSQPTHIFLGQEPITENRRRYADIGGVDPGLVAEVVKGLPKHRIQTPAGIKNISEKLYIRKDGPYMCIVGI